MKSFNQIKNPLCTSIKNLILKLLSTFQSDPCNHVRKIKKSGFEKNAFKVWSLKFEVIDRAQIFGRALKKNSYYKIKFIFYGIKHCFCKKNWLFQNSRVVLPLKCDLKFDPLTINSALSKRNCVTSRLCLYLPPPTSRSVTF